MNTIIRNKLISKRYSKIFCVYCLFITSELKLSYYLNMLTFQIEGPGDENSLDVEVLQVQTPTPIEDVEVKIFSFLMSLH